uniref:Serpentine receptor class gamma n=1 Tax=Panagrellus redivivus TaxID=6233 RepID=A0A7E4ZWX2_PANRE
MIILALSGSSTFIVLTIYQLIFQCVNTSLLKVRVLRRVFSNAIFVYLFFLWTFFSWILALFAIFLLSVNNEKETNTVFVADIPALAPLIAATPSFDGFHPDLTTPFLTTYVNITMFSVAAVVISSAILFIAFVKHMNRIKNDVLPYTFTGFVMMYK